MKRLDSPIVSLIVSNLSDKNVLLGANDRVSPLCQSYTSSTPYTSTLRSSSSSTRSGTSTLAGISLFPSSSTRISIFSNRSRTRLPVGGKLVRPPVKSIGSSAVANACRARCSMSEYSNNARISTYPSASTRSGRFRNTGPTHFGSFNRKPPFNRLLIFIQL